MSTSTSKDGRRRRIQRSRADLLSDFITIAGQFTMISNPLGQVTIIVGTGNDEFGQRIDSVFSYSQITNPYVHTMQSDHGLTIVTYPRGMNNKQLRNVNKKLNDLKQVLQERVREMREMRETMNESEEETTTEETRNKRKRRNQSSPTPSRTSTPTTATANDPPQNEHDKPYPGPVLIEAFRMKRYEEGEIE